MSRCEDGGIRWQRVSAAVMVRHLAALIDLTLLASILPPEFPPHSPPPPVYVRAAGLWDRMNYS